MFYGVICILSDGHRASKEWAESSSHKMRTQKAKTFGPGREQKGGDWKKKRGKQCTVRE